MRQLKSSLGDWCWSSGLEYSNTGLSTIRKSVFALTVFFPPEWSSGSGSENRRAEWSYLVKNPLWGNSPITSGTTSCLSQDSGETFSYKKVSAVMFVWQQRFILCFFFVVVPVHQWRHGLRFVSERLGEPDRHWTDAVVLRYCLWRFDLRCSAWVCCRCHTYCPISSCPLRLKPPHHEQLLQWEPGWWPVCNIYSSHIHTLTVNKVSAVRVTDC